MDPKRLAEAADLEVLGRFLTSYYNIPGTAVPVRTYDLFVIWHHKTMPTPSLRMATAEPGTLPTAARSSSRGIGSCSGSWS
jgi:hypothetical protein